MRLGAHLARLARSTLALYGLGLAGDLGERCLEVSGRSVLPSVLRIHVRPVSGSQGPGLKVEVTLGPLGTSHWPAWPALPLRIAWVDWEGGLGCHKWADRSSIAAVRAGLRLGSLDVVGIGAGEALLEAERANVVAVAGSELWTPASDSRVLDGIGLSLVREVAGELGFTLGSKTLRSDELAGVDEVFLVNSVRPIEAVGEIVKYVGATPGAEGEVVARPAHGPESVAAKVAGAIARRFWDEAG